MELSSSSVSDVTHGRSPLGHARPTSPHLWSTRAGDNAASDVGMGSLTCKCGVQIMTQLTAELNGKWSSMTLPGAPCLIPGLNSPNPDSWAQQPKPRFLGSTAQILGSTAQVSHPTAPAPGSCSSRLLLVTGPAPDGWLIYPLPAHANELPCTTQ